MPDKDQLYIKYRVYHEPTLTPHMEDKVGHPVPVKSTYLEHDDHEFETWTEMEEVMGLYFVLRPEGDHHARVAMAAYAYSCRQEFPHLAADIIKMVEEIEWEEQTGGNKGDFPLDDEDYISGDHLSDNVVEILRKKATPDV